MVRCLDERYCHPPPPGCPRVGTVCACACACVRACVCVCVCVSVCVCVCVCKGAHSVYTQYASTYQIPIMSLKENLLLIALYPEE